MTQQDPTPNSTQEHPGTDSGAELEISRAIEEEQKAIGEQPPADISGHTFTVFMTELKALSEPEKKLEHTIKFMEEAISQTGVPHFKEFWEARRISLDLFKENINATLRMNLWARYSELCREARKLKEIFDEQSAFAAEQIEIAVSAIEGEVNYFKELLTKMGDVHFEVESKVIQKHYEQYNRLQKELNLLNSYASKTNALRKELIKTEMRVRHKNKFFERLSHLGDSIFPRRKELIQEVSSLFVQDVDHFIQTTFVTELKTPDLFDAREEIKALQQAAKHLTLNTEAFSTTRKSLSECWDSIKNVVKERRKVVSEQKAAYKAHFDQFSQELDALTQSFAAKELADRDCAAKLDEIIERMRKTTLGKMEIRTLREKAKGLRETLSSRLNEQDRARREELKKKEEEKLAKFTDCKESLKKLIADVDTETVDALTERLDAIDATPFTKMQRQEIETLIRKAKDAIDDKKQRRVFDLPKDTQEALARLEEFLEEREAAKETIKEELERLRKMLKKSGLDFSQAMQYNELVQNQKERLEKVEATISEIEEKIDKLQA